MNAFAKTIIATGVAALFAWVFMAVILKDTEPDAVSDYFVVAAMCGTAISTFMSFQRLAKIQGAFGFIHDIALVVAIVLVATLLGGTLIFPLAGTLMAPALIVRSLTSDPEPVLILIAFVIAMLILSRLGHRN